MSKVNTPIYGIKYHVAPVVFDWVNFDGEDVFAAWNLEASQSAKRPMVDICYCATQALNNIVLKTVQWDRKRFKESRLAISSFEKSNSK